jgi:coenzyme F420-0:L-glutamate ligase/coenzyme F420-1:gamma-L-glutamate ligase
MVDANDSLDSLLTGAMQQQDLEFADNDVLVIAQKIVSKAENRLVRLDEIQASEAARELACEVDKDERLVELDRKSTRLNSSH